jgi:hypothetical protein
MIREPLDDRAAKRKIAYLEIIQRVRESVSDNKGQPF